MSEGLVCVTGDKEPIQDVRFQKKETVSFSICTRSSMESLSSLSREKQLLAMPAKNVVTECRDEPVTSQHSVKKLAQLSHRFAIVHANARVLPRRPRHPGTHATSALPLDPPQHPQASGDAQRLLPAPPIL